MSRRDLIKGVAAAGAAACAGVAPADASGAPGGLPRCRPEEAGVASAGLLGFLDAVEQKVGGLHSFMLVRQGKVAAEGYWKPYGPRYPHMLFSLSKSFTSTAIGQAIGDSLLSLDDTVLSFFPDRAPAKPDANLRAMRIRHLLTMTTGHDQDTIDRTTRATEGDWVRAFLSIPVEHAPGSKFVYNSGATYMLSAILQKITGKRLLDYLRPRLFGPLGITGMTWQTCPKGINTGGWGLSVKTEDIARFGLLYLHKGVWRGRRLVPEAWVTAATSKQVPNGDDPNSDWAQGYGYQFWRCRHNAYRGDGAFGQYCIVMPEHDAVMAITSGVADMQAVLNAIWDNLLHRMGSPALPGPDEKTLAERLKTLEVASPGGASLAPDTTRVDGRTYRLEQNDRKIVAASFSVKAGRVTMTLTNDRGEHTLVCGMADWVRGTTALEGEPPAKIATRGAWTSDDTLMMKVCFYETPFERTITVKFSGEDVTITWKDNVGFGPTEGPTLKGKAVA